MSRVNYKALLLLIAVFLAALLVGGKFVTSLFLVTFFLILLCYSTGKSVHKNLVSIVWKGTNKVEVGDKVNVSMDLYNAGLLPVPYFRVHTNLPQKLTGEEKRPHIYSIMPGVKKNIEKEVVCRHKGVYKVGFMEVEFSDIFGIFKWKKTFDEDIYLCVYPKVTALKNFNIPVKQPYGTVRVNQNAFEDFSSTKDIRKYAVGDSMKKVHWKVTAHRGDFYVRNVELNASADLNVFLDLYSGSYNGDRADDLEEKAAECAASIIRYAFARSMSVNLAAKGESPISLSGKGINRFHEFLDVITRSSVCGDIPVWELVKKEVRKLDWDATVVIITPNMEGLPIDTIGALKTTGVDLVLVYICENRTVENEILDKLSLDNVRVFTVGIEDDIRQVLGGYYEK